MIRLIPCLVRFSVSLSLISRSVVFRCGRSDNRLGRNGIFDPQYPGLGKIKHKRRVECHRYRLSGQAGCQGCTAAGPMLGSTLRSAPGVGERREAKACFFLLPVRLQCCLLSPHFDRCKPTTTPVGCAFDFGENEIKRKCCHEKLTSSLHLVATHKKGGRCDNGRRLAVPRRPKQRYGKILQKKKTKKQKSKAQQVGEGNKIKIKLYGNGFGARSSFRL